MTKTKAELEAFWEQNDGKLIRSYGKWLIAYGIIIALVCAFWIFYIISQVNKSELTGFGIAVVTFYFACICSSIYYVFVGENIVRKKFSPNKINNASTVVITLVVITAICQLLLTAQGGGAITTIFGLLDIITLVDAIRYKNHSHEAYLNFYEGNNIKNTSANKSKKESKNTITTTKDKADTKEDEYDDGL